MTMELGACQALSLCNFERHVDCPKFECRKCAWVLTMRFTLFFLSLEFGYNCQYLCSFFPFKNTRTHVYRFQCTDNSYLVLSWLFWWQANINIGWIKTDAIAMCPCCLSVNGHMAAHDSALFLFGFVVLCLLEHIMKTVQHQSNKQDDAAM